MVGVVARLPRKQVAGIFTILATALNLFRLFKLPVGEIGNVTEQEGSDLRAAEKTGKVLAGLGLVMVGWLVYGSVLAFGCEGCYNAGGCEQTLFGFAFGLIILVWSLAGMAGIGGLCVACAVATGLHGDMEVAVARRAARGAAFGTTDSYLALRRVSAV